MMTKFVLSVATLGLFLVGLPAYAQHADVLVQDVNGQLVTGAANFENNTWLVGQRVFERQFLSNFRTSDPGFASLETGNSLLEGGVVGLTPGIDLMVDIVPTTIDGQQANFWYWDGIDADDDGFELTDVAFEMAPSGVTWNVFDDNFDLYTADGSDSVVPGALIQQTFSSDGAVHSHLILQVADSDPQADPPQGVYLSAMVLRAEGYEDSEPFMFVHRTSELTNEPRDIAATWVRENYGSLIGEALPGDFDDSGTVDGADFLTWQRELGTVAELTIWQNSYGVAALSTQGTLISVPEAGALWSAIIAIASFAVSQRAVR